MNVLILLSTFSEMVQMLLTHPLFRDKASFLDWAGLFSMGFYRETEPLLRSVYEEYSNAVLNNCSLSELPEYGLMLAVMEGVLLALGPASEMERAYDSLKRLMDARKKARSLGIAVPASGLFADMPASVRMWVPAGLGKTVI